MSYLVNIIDCDGLLASGHFDGPANLQVTDLTPIDPDTLYRDPIAAIDASLTAQGFQGRDGAADGYTTLDIRI